MELTCYQYTRYEMCRRQGKLMMKMLVVTPPLKMHLGTVLPRIWVTLKFSMIRYSSPFAKFQKPLFPMSPSMRTHMISNPNLCPSSLEIPARQCCSFLLSLFVILHQSLFHMFYVFSLSPWYLIVRSSSHFINFTERTRNHSCVFFVCVLAFLCLIFLNVLSVCRKSIFVNFFGNSLIRLFD